MSTLGLVLLLGTAACGEDSTGPEDRLVVDLEGRLERSGTVTLTVSLEGRALADSLLEWSAEPAAAVTFLDQSTVRLDSVGPVELRAEATVDERVERGGATLDVATPPAVVFDLLRDGNRDVYRVALDGLDLMRLTTAPGDDVDPTAAAGVVVFTSFRDGNAELYSVPPDGGSPTRLTSTGEDEIQPALSPDGARVAYMSDAGGTFKLWSAASDGTGPEPLTESFGTGGSVEASPAWAPGGASLVFVSTTQGTSDLFTLVPGDAPALLLDGDDAEVEPAWGPGERVAFTSDRTGDAEVFFLELDQADPPSSPVTRLTARTGPDGEAAWLPDGRLVYTAWVGGVPELRWIDPEAAGPGTVIPVGAGEPRRPAGVQP